MMDCKRALADAEGDVEKALVLLRERGLSKAGKRAGRETSEGKVEYSISGGRGTLIELGCETDFVAKNDEFLDLMKELALGVCAFDPVAVGSDDLPAELVEAEKAKYETETKGKPAEIAVKIIEGKLEKNLFSQKCLMHMPFPKEDKFKGTYGKFLASKVAILKENITLRRFHRFELGG